MGVPTKGRAGLVPLLAIATAQLMLVLDDSIVNIALPSIQAELNVQPVHLPWVVNAYILAFGALVTCGAASAPCRSALRSSSSLRSSAGSGRSTHPAVCREGGLPR